MPDITMCQDKTCPKKNECYRYTAKPSEMRQAYFAGSTRETEGECEYFWDTAKWEKAYKKKAKQFGRGL